VFLYADDMNAANTLLHIKDYVSTENTSTVFHPPGSSWINLKAPTFHPHSNECGPRMLLTLTMMALHHMPNDQTLYSYIHPNLAQLSCWWVAKTLISNDIDLSPIINCSHSYSDSFTSIHMEANPFDLAHIPSLPSSQYFDDQDIIHLSQSTSIGSSSSFPQSPSKTRMKQISRPIAMSRVHNNMESNGIKSGNDNNCQQALSQHSTQIGQQHISNWTYHHPFIPGISYNNPSTLPNVPHDPHSAFVNHLIPFGTPIKSVDATKILRVIVLNTQHLFQIYGDAIDMAKIIFHLKTLGTSMFVPISPNVNWCNPSNWVRTKQRFREISHYIHLSANCSDNGKQQSYLATSIVGGTAILSFQSWTSRVSSATNDDSGFGIFSITTIQGKQNKKISFIAVYIAVQKGSDIGVESLFAQQCTIFEQQHKHSPNNIHDKILP